MKPRLSSALLWLRHHNTKRAGVEAGGLFLAFLAYTLASIIGATIVYPFVSSWLSLFAFLGVYASFVFGAVISFPIFILTLWAFAAAGHEAALPDVLG